MLRPSRPMIRPFRSSLGEIDHRDGRLDGMLGGASLDGVDDDVAGPHLGRLARLGLDALDHVGGVAPGVGLDLAEQQFLGLVGGQAGDALQFALLLGEQLLAPRRGGGGRLLPVAQRLLARLVLLVNLVGGGQAGDDLLFLLGDGLFDAGHLAASLLGEPVGLHHNLVGLLLGGEQRLLLLRFGLALGLADQPAGILIGPADRFGGNPLACGHPVEEDGKGRGNGNGGGKQRGKCSRHI